MNNRLIKEIIALTAMSLVIAFTYNTLSDKGIPLIGKGVEMQWESDSALAKYVKADSALSSVGSIEITGQGKDSKINSSVNSESIQSENKKNEKTVSEKKVKIVFSSDSLKKAVKQQENIIKSNEPEKPATPTAITVDQAYKLFMGGNALFLDARMDAEYNTGHIKGAMSFPLKKYDQLYPKISNINKDALIVCYCDGAGCDLSIDLAKKLAQTGYRNVKIFYSGWNDWKERNYPIE